MTLSLTRLVQFSFETEIRLLHQPSSYSRLAQLPASDRTRPFFPLSVFITSPPPPRPSPQLVGRTVINQGKTRVALHLHTSSPEFFRVPFQRERLHQKLHQPALEYARSTCSDLTVATLFLLSSIDLFHLLLFLRSIMKY